eukprot:TRINITY_DN24820_c0_g1_i6.p1 TRINITY_DN24820_c0_g1~~TRINITY_DN24820_c0_g1_i6.p1  ORF type:complete len:191 (+),score=55.46 TRINITY_DN24820_c0_g1_i6:136-708(+)
MIRRPPRSTLSSSSAASDVYKRQGINAEYGGHCSTMSQDEHMLRALQLSRLLWTLFLFLAGCMVAVCLLPHRKLGNSPETHPAHILGYSAATMALVSFLLPRPAVPPGQRRMLAQYSLVGTGAMTLILAYRGAGLFYKDDGVVSWHMGVYTVACLGSAYCMLQGSRQIPAVSTEEEVGPVAKDAAARKKH